MYKIRDTGAAVMAYIAVMTLGDRRVQKLRGVTEHWLNDQRRRIAHNLQME